MEPLSASNERVAANRRSARFNILGYAAMFCASGVVLIVASIIIIQHDKHLDDEEKQNVEIVEYGGISGGVLAMYNGLFFAYLLTKIPNTEGQTQLITTQTYLLIASMVLYAGGAVVTYLFAQPFEDRKLQIMFYVISGGCAFVVFSTISYLQFIWTFAREFGVQLCKGTHSTPHEQSARNNTMYPSVGMR